MLDKLSVIAWLILGLLLTPLDSEAQKSGKIYTIGFLALSSASPNQASPLYAEDGLTETFFNALRQLGYSEGEHFVIERRFADNQLDRLPGLAAELVAGHPDLILTVSTPAACAAQQATAAIPIVFSLSSDPVNEGFVVSLARPGGNMTGYKWGVISTSKWLELLKELVPGLRRVARLCPGAEFERCSAWDWNAAFPEIDLEYEIFEVGRPEDFDQVFNAARRAGHGAVAISTFAWFYAHEKRLGKAAAQSPLPVIFDSLVFVEHGGLIGLAENPVYPMERIAALVDKILQGANPAELPVEQSFQFELWLNLKTAQTHGIEIPPSIMIQATNLIQ